MNASDSFGQWLKRERKTRRLTQQQLGERVSYSGEHVRKAEAGERHFGREQAEQLADLLAIPEDERESFIAWARGGPGPAHLLRSLSSTQMCASWWRDTNVAPLYGREAELRTLTAWIADRGTRIVAIVGQGGIGKTSLVTHLVRTFQGPVRRASVSLRVDALPATRVLTGWIDQLGGELPPGITETFSDLLNQLIHLLRRESALLVLDNVESVFKAGERAGQYRDGVYEQEYGALFEALCANDHRGRLILTSRELPPEIERYAVAPALPARVLRLGPLETVACRQIMERGVITLSSEALDALVARYGGSPLCLMQAASLIRREHDGDSVAFLESRDTLAGNISGLLDEQVARLSPDEQEVLYWLACYREPVPLSLPMKDSLLDAAAVRSAIRSLEDRHLVERYAERGTTSFGLQPVVLEHATSRLIDDATREIIALTGAYRVLTRIAFTTAQGWEYMQEAQVRFILEPMIDILRKRYRSHESIVHLLAKTMEVLRSKPQGEQCYGGGNVANLLRHVQAHLRGADLSRVNLWNVDFRRVEMQDANLSGADVSGARFTEPIGGIWAIAMSPNGEYLVAATARGQIRRWKLDTLEPLSSYEGHEDKVYALAFSPDGSRLISGGFDCRIKIWNTETGECMRTILGHTKEIRSLAVNPDGMMLASGSHDRTVAIWDLRSGALIRRLTDHEAEVRAVAFSPDGSALATGGRDRIIRIWGTNDWHRIAALREHTASVEAIAFSPLPDTTMVTGGADNTIRIWHADGWRCTDCKRQHTDWIWAVAISPDGSLLATASQDRTVRLWRTSDWTCIRVLTAHTEAVVMAAFAPDTTLVTSGPDKDIRVWRACDWECVRVVRGYGAEITTLALSADGAAVATADVSRTVHIWRTADWQHTATLEGQKSRVWILAFSPAKRLLATGDEDGTIRVWGWDSDAPACIKVLAAHSAPVKALAFSPNGAFLASGGHDLTVRIFRTADWTCMAELGGYDREVMLIRYSPDGSLLATTSFAPTIRVYETTNWTLLPTSPVLGDIARSIAFHPRGDVFTVAGDDGIIHIYRVNGQQFSEECSLPAHDGRIISTTFSRDGRLYASVGTDQAIKMWDTADDWRYIDAFRGVQGHLENRHLIAFLGENAVLSGEQDGTMRLWRSGSENPALTLRADRPYERMNIRGMIGMTDDQRSTLRDLGATEIEALALPE